MLSASWLLAAVLVQDTTTARDTTARGRITALPVGSYSEVTGLQFGITAMLDLTTSADTLARASTASIYAARTAREHTKAYAQLDRWAADNAHHVRVRAEYISYPLPFFGIGAGTADTAEEWYSSGVTTLHLFLQSRHPATDVYTHAGIRHVRSVMRDVEPSRLLAGGSVDGSGGSSVTAVELGIVNDSRDHVTAPRNGTYQRFILSRAPGWFGSRPLWRFSADARRYLPLGARHSVAVQVQLDAVTRAAPFDYLPMLGADTAMRGYARGRYRDRNALTAQAEFRSGYWKRAGLIAFAGAGTVAPSLEALGSAPWYPTAGIGLRAMLVPRQRTLVRADLGFGRSSWGISVGIGEAF